MTAALVLVLMAPPGNGARMSRLAADLIAAHAEIAWSSPRWLAADEAMEIAAEVSAPDHVRALHDTAARLLDRAPIDVCVVPAANRRKRLLVADMDSTVIGQECIDEMADVMGLKPRVAAITERAMRGELDFEAALRARLGLLAGIGEADLEAVFRERVTLDPGARTLVATMRASGARCALVSGGFTFFTARVAAAAGFDEHHANQLEMADGRLTGHVVGPILGREAKLATLERLRAAHGLGAADTLAVGDGANDLAMIGAAGLGVAYHAKPVVAAEAHAAIRHCDLSALLFLQGYRREEHVGRGR